MGWKPGIITAYREEKNTSLKQQIITEKMRHAEKLLSAGAMTIPEIANSVGYYDIKHFRKTLQQYLQKKGGEAL